MTEQTHIREREIYRVTWIGFFVNLILTVGKLFAGIWGRSSAMVADAIHSASDFATDLVVLLFVRVSSRPRDEDHDYGHGKYETLATLIIGLALAAVGVKLLWNGCLSIRDFMDGKLPEQPGQVALWAAVVSIVTKELLYRYTVRVGRKAGYRLRLLLRRRMAFGRPCRRNHRRGADSLHSGTIGQDRTGRAA